MNKLMIVLSSVRPVRLGEPITEWVKAAAEATGDFDVEVVDLRELALPFMDEPNHPAMHKYTKPYTIAWSEMVEAADAFIFVTPEYNHSFSPALKNAIDYLNSEWWRKPYGIVSYGGVSGGTRGVTALEPVLSPLGLVRTGAFVELPFASKQVTDGVFSPSEKDTAILGHQLADLVILADGLKPIRAQKV